MLKEIDAWVLDSVYQRLSDWFSDKHQKTPFLLTRICIYLDLLCQMIFSVLRSNGQPSLWGFVFASLFPCLILLFNRKEELRYETAKSWGTMNSLRIPLRYMRIIYLVLFPFGAVVSVDRMLSGTDMSLLMGMSQLLINIAITSALYFVACTPKPPKPQEDEVPEDAVLEGT